MRKQQTRKKIEPAANADRPDYRNYSFRAVDWLEFFARMTGKGLLICWLFYDSLRASAVLLPFAVVDYRKMKREKKRKRDMELAVQFKAMIEAVAGSLQAGYSLERAFADAGRDLELIYGDRQKAMILRELSLIRTGLSMNIPLETLLKDFGNRSGNEDIRNFANVVLVAKKSGGNLVHIIQKTVQCMGDKLAVEEEIATLLAAKRLEERIMMVMPYGMLLYLRIGSKGFFDVLYHNVPGALCMTAFLAVVYAAGAWGERIMDIQV